MRDAFLALNRHLPEPLLLIDGRDGNLVAANHAAGELFGLGLEQLEGSSLAALGAEEPERLLRHIRTCLRSSEPLPGAIWLRTGTAPTRLRTEGWRVGGVEGLVVLRVWRPDDQDRFLLLGQKVEELNLEIAKRQSLQAQRERLLKRLTRLQEVTAALSEVTTPEQVVGVILKLGREAIHASSVVVCRSRPAEKVVEVLGAEGYPPDVVERFTRVPFDAALPLAEAIRTGEWVVIGGGREYRARYPETAEVVLAGEDASFISVPMEVQGKVLGGVGFSFRPAQALDVEDQQFLAALISQCTQAFERADLFEAERRARADAESASRAKDEFLAMLGHELRNPLSPILTALQLMQLRGIGAEKERAIIERQVNHLMQLVDDLLDVSRVTRGKIELKRERVEIGDVLAKAVEVASPLIEQRGHHLRLEVPGEGLRVNGDPTRLAQIFSNLLTNAAKYTDDGGEISIAAERLGDEVVVQVRDTGVGISPEMLPRIFDLFTQEPQALDRSQGGLGLGLAIVRSMVELHGGSVAAQSEGRGRGSAFTVRLPAVEVDVAVSPPRPTSRERRILEASGSRPRILIVDDNTDAAEVLASLLTALGCDTRIAHDGPSALPLARTFRPDLALLDIGLPVMDGYELARRLREQEPVNRLRLVAVTGYGQESDKMRSIAAGFDAHVVKPLSGEVLDALLKKFAPPRA